LDRDGVANHVLDPVSLRRRTLGPGRHRAFVTGAADTRESAVKTIPRGCVVAARLCSRDSPCPSELRALDLTADDIALFNGCGSPLHGNGLRDPGAMAANRLQPACGRTEPGDLPTCWLVTGDERSHRLVRWRGGWSAGVKLDTVIPDDAPSRRAVGSSCSRPRRRCSASRGRVRSSTTRQVPATDATLLSRPRAVVGPGVVR
jgi:hypothetical protein